MKNDEFPEHQASERSELAQVLRELINLLLENLLEIEKISLEIVSLEKDLANEDSDFGSMFLELLFEPGKFATD